MLKKKNNIQTLINQYLDISQTYINFSQRLSTFIVARESTVIVVLPDVVSGGRVDDGSPPSKRIEIIHQYISLLVQE